MPTQNETTVSEYSRSRAKIVMILSDTTAKNASISSIDHVSLIAVGSLERISDCGKGPRMTPLAKSVKFREKFIKIGAKNDEIDRKNAKFVKNQKILTNFCPNS